VIHGVRLEAVLAAGYAIFLGATAGGLELVARHSRRRAEGMATAGFRFRPEHDFWECPTGERLHRFGEDAERRVVRYRAPAHVCNCCGIKIQCTDSDQGREVERSLDSWIATEMGRFHRGLSLTLLLLAGLILVVELFRFRRPPEEFLLAGLLVPISLLGAKLLGVFRGERS
jgi:hypothetical protein